MKLHDNETDTKVKENKHNENEMEFYWMRFGDTVHDVIYRSRPVC